MKLQYALPLLAIGGLALLMAEPAVAAPRHGEHAAREQQAEQHARHTGSRGTHADRAANRHSNNVWAARSNRNVWRGNPRANARVNMRVRMLPAHRFSGRFARFNARDRALWRRGHWRHSWHHGRYGWWWFTGGGWYFYSTPIYPYPDVVSTTYYLDDTYADDSGYNWYYCQDPPGYYPYVQTCNGPWQTVPASPEGYQSAPGPQDQAGPQDDQGPPPGYNDQQSGPDDQGPPPGYNDQQSGPDDQGPPPGYNDQQSGPDNQGPPQGNGDQQSGPYDQGPPPDDNGPGY